MSQEHTPFLALNGATRLPAGGFRSSAVQTLQQCFGGWGEVGHLSMPLTRGLPSAARPNRRTLRSRRRGGSNSMPPATAGGLRKLLLFGSRPTDSGLPLRSGLLLGSRLASSRLASRCLASGRLAGSSLLRSSLFLRGGFLLRRRLLRCCLLRSGLTSGRLLNQCSSPLRVEPRIGSRFYSSPTYLLITR